MKHPFLAIAAVFALGLCGAAHAGNVDDFIAHMKATGRYHEVIIPEQYKTLRSEENDRSLLTLHRAGLSSDTARKAVWAMNYRPQSACAVYASNIVGFAEMARMAPDAPNSYDPDQSIIQIERNGLCERRNLGR